MPTTYLHKRRTEALQDLLLKRHQAPTSNARMRQSGVDIPARLQGKVPYSDVLLKAGHEDDLDKELRYRTVLPCVPFGEENKQVHPVPTRDFVARPYDEMTFF